MIKLIIRSYVRNIDFQIEKLILFVSLFLSAIQIALSFERYELYVLGLQQIAL